MRNRSHSTPVPEAATRARTRAADCIPCCADGADSPALFTIIHISACVQDPVALPRPVIDSTSSASSPGTLAFRNRARKHLRTICSSRTALHCTHGQHGHHRQQASRLCAPAHHHHTRHALCGRTTSFTATLRRSSDSRVESVDIPRCAGPFHTAILALQPDTDPPERTGRVRGDSRRQQ
jgi:hypothetical protein